jgi:septal ring factor EnvC (AmiA/AmiB activator)
MPIVVTVGGYMNRRAFRVLSLGMIGVLVTTLPGCLSPVTSGLDKVIQQLRLTNEQLAAMNGRIEETTRKLLETNERLAKIEARLRETNQKLDTVDTSLNHTNEKLGTVEQTAQGFEQGLKHFFTALRKARTLDRSGPPASSSLLPRQSLFVSSRRNRQADH